MLAYTGEEKRLLIFEKNNLKVNSSWHECIVENEEKAAVKSQRKQSPPGLHSKRKKWKNLQGILTKTVQNGLNGKTDIAIIHKNFK